jgi:hypothetical protein
VGDFRIDKAEVQLLVEIDEQSAPCHLIQKGLCFRMCQEVVVKQYELASSTPQQIVEITDLMDATLFDRH